MMFVPRLDSVRPKLMANTSGDSTVSGALYSCRAQNFKAGHESAGIQRTCGVNNENMASSTSKNVLASLGNCDSVHDDKKNSLNGNSDLKERDGNERHDRLEALQNHSGNLESG